MISKGGFASYSSLMSEMSACLFFYSRKTERCLHDDLEKPVIVFGQVYKTLQEEIGAILHDFAREVVKIPEEITPHIYCETIKFIVYGNGVLFDGPKALEISLAIYAGACHISGAFKWGFGWYD
jgi:hypothetical protein